MQTKIFKKRYLYLCILALFLINTQLVYGQRGKISGVVTDFNTKEPLVGVNVFIVGSTIGATTDFEGKYVILNVLPGTYSVAASMVGYGKLVYSGVQVFIDRTTELNFKLKDESVQMDQVVIVAEKPKIVKDQTSSATTIDDIQLKSAPIEGLRGAMDLTASFQKNEKGDYSVRGSGTYEVKFQINGVDQQTTNTSIPGYGGADKANNSWKFDVNPLGVQQIQLISGGFSAEYGNAQAGVVKVVLKEGNNKITGEARMEYRPAGLYHFGEYVYSKNNFEWKKWGNLNYWYANQKNVIKDISPYLYNRMYIQNNATAADSQRVLDEIAWAYNVWLKNHTPSEDNPLGVYDYRDHIYTRYMVGFGGPLGTNPELLKFYFSGEYRKNPTRLPTSEKDQIYQNYILNLTYKPVAEHKFRFMGSFQKYKGGLFSGSSDIRWSGLTNTSESGKYAVYQDPIRTEQTVAQSLNWVYTINTNSFFETNIAHQTETYELPYIYIPGFNSSVDRLDSLADPRGTILKSGIWWDHDYFLRLDAASTNFYQDYRAENYSLTIDYTNQILKTNLLKAGIRFYYWDIFNNGVAYSFRTNSYVAHYGVAEYYKAYPFNYAFYIQDKMEYEGMVANLGVRVEAYNFQSNKPVDRFNPFYPGTERPGIYGNPNTVPSKTQVTVLPRVGVSFPIGENTAFRIQYGHFASMPIFTQALTTKTYRGWSALGNPDLEPKKTINYEFGIQQVIDENHRIDVAIYYNDRVSQIGTQDVAALTGDLRYFAAFNNNNEPLYLYQSFENNRFGSTIGIEATFEKISMGNWSYRLSYNLSQTTEGRYGYAVLYPDNSRNFALRSTTGEFLSPYDRTHSFRGLLQYILKDGEGFEIFGFKPFENSVFGLSYTVQSGLPFTYVTDFDLKDVSYNRRYPLESNFDFNFNKEVFYSGVKFIIGLRIMNLFNNKWLTPMDSQSDQQDKIAWVENGVTMDNPVDNPNKRSYLLYPFRTYKNTPTQFIFTVGIGF
jgi:outer membrane receptor protein involved in Fe transport